jgi:hypothetical protein
MQPTKITTEYRAKFNLANNCQGSLTAPDLETIRSSIEALVPGGKGVIVDQDKDNRNAYLYHPALFEGKHPFGWINEVSVPENLAVEKMVSALNANRAASSGR